MSVQIELVCFRETEAVDPAVGLYFWRHYTIEPRVADGGWTIRVHHDASGRPYRIGPDSLMAFFNAPPARSDVAAEVASLDEARRFFAEEARGT